MCGDVSGVRKRGGSGQGFPTCPSGPPRPLACASASTRSVCIVTRHLSLIMPLGGGVGSGSRGEQLPFSATPSSCTYARGTAHSPSQGLPHTHPRASLRITARPLALPPSRTLLSPSPARTPPYIPPRIGAYHALLSSSPALARRCVHGCSACVHTRVSCAWVKGAAICVCFSCMLLPVCILRAGIWACTSALLRGAPDDPMLALPQGLVPADRDRL